MSTAFLRPFRSIRNSIPGTFISALSEVILEVYAALFSALNVKLTGARRLCARPQFIRGGGQMSDSTYEHDRVEQPRVAYFSA